MSRGRVTSRYLEEEFDRQLRAVGLPEPEREARLIPGRRFRFDRSWADVHLALEIEGGTYAAKGARPCPLCGQQQRGAHGTGAGIERDCEKANLAALHGWHLLRGTPAMVRDGRLLAAVEAFFRSRKEG